MAYPSYGRLCIRISDTHRMLVLQFFGDLSPCLYQNLRHSHHSLPGFFRVLLSSFQWTKILANRRTAYTSLIPKRWTIFTINTTRCNVIFRLGDTPTQRDKGGMVNCTDRVEFRSSNSWTATQSTLFHGFAYKRSWILCHH